MKQYLITKQTPTLGLGTFTTIDIPSGKVIMEVGGDTFPKEIAAHSPQFDDFLQISHDLFKGVSGSVDDALNHSCDPNCYLKIVGNRVLLCALYLIKAGSELTIDYSCSSTDTIDEWHMKCLCGNVKCRKIISGYQYLNKELQEEYKSKDMIPMFLRYDIFEK